MQKILNKVHARAAASKPYNRSKRRSAPTIIPTLLETNAEQLVVFTDGAAPGNGQSHARAGCGVFFGVNDPRNIACRVPLELPQTNQVAELLAMTLAVEHLKEAKEIRRVVIYSDSSYSVQGINSWIHGWKRNKWMTSANKPVLHDAIWKRLDTARTDLNVEFIHVRGHCGIAGNEAADKLAVEGAKLSG